MKHLAMTPIRRSVLDAAARHIAEHGYSPSSKDLMEGSEAKSTSEVMYCLRRLREDGYVTYRDNTSRTVRIADEEAHFGRPEPVAPDIDAQLNQLLRRDYDPERVYRAMVWQQARIVELEGQKDGAYRERDKLVAALSKLFHSYRSRHPMADEWEDDWRNIIVIDLPTGQVSWHIHDSELPLFMHLPLQDNNWDGHTTEEKYARLAALEATTQEVGDD